MKYKVLLFLLLVLSVEAFSQSQNNKAYLLFNEAAELYKPQAPANDEFMRVEVEINPEIMQTDLISYGDKIIVDLYSEEQFEVAVTSIDTNVMGVTTIVGTQKSDDHSNLIITFDKKNRFFATARLFNENRLFHITSNPHRNEHYLAEKDMEVMEIGKCEGVITEDD